MTQIGFPLDFNKKSIMCHGNINHTSALDFSADVEAYLSEELKNGAILGSYEQYPITACHISTIPRTGDN